MAKIPEGFHNITPDLTVDPASEAIDFYKRAFGAEEMFRMNAPDGARVLHATLRIGDSKVMMSDPFPGWPAPQRGSSVTLHLYVEDADATYERATSAGATVVMPIDNAPWGDRYAIVDDPFGIRWSIATKQEDVDPEEVQKRLMKLSG